MKNYRSGFHPDGREASSWHGMDGKLSIVLNLPKYASFTMNFSCESVSDGASGNGKPRNETRVSESCLNACCGDICMTRLPMATRNIVS